MSTLCFTGHRNLSQFDTDWIVQQITIQVHEAIQDGYDSFISGGAIGIDQLAAQIVIKARKKAHIKLIFARPFPTQDNVWPQQNAITYRTLLQQADFVYDVSPNPTNRYEAINYLQRRNEWMVNNSTRLVAVWNGAKGGTANCFNYAKKQPHINIIRLDPQTQKVSRMFKKTELDMDDI